MAPSRRLVFLGFLCVLVVGSLLNSRYTGYTRLLKDPVELVLSPATHLLRPLASKARQRIDKPPVDERTVERIWDNYQQEIAKVHRLRSALAELRLNYQSLRNLKAQLGDQADDYVYPSVVAGPYSPASHSLKINLGSNHGLAVGQAVMDGANLVGRIDRVSPMNAWVRLITAPGTKINAIITDAILPVDQLITGRFVACQLDAAGPDHFTAIVRKPASVHQGQYVRLLDRDWPEQAQGLLVGQVVEITDYPDQPHLRQQIRVQTFRSLRYLQRVDVVIARQFRSAAQ